MRNKTSRLLAMLLALSMVMQFGFVPASANDDTTGTQAPELIYKLDFSDAEDRGKNSASTEIPSASFVGSGYAYTENDIKGNTSVQLSGGSARTNYITIDGEVLNRDSITLAGWFKIPSTVTNWSRLIEIYGDNSNFISAMPYANNYYNGLHICAKIDGTALRGADDKDNIIYEGKDTDASVNTPEAGFGLPVYDAWVHYAYEFTPEALKIYQNGKLMKSLAGDFTASQFYTEKAKIVLGATLVTTLSDKDINASYADIRVYEGALTEDEITSEYGLTYTDFLTTSYDFENGLTDSVRGYDGTFTGTASVGQVEGKGNVLILDGNVNGNNVSANRSSMRMPSKVIHGHNNITVMMDLYVDSATGNYGRIFEFSQSSSASWMVGTKWGSSTVLRHSYSNGVSSAMQGKAFFDEWVHFAVTIDGKTAKVYVNGEILCESDTFDYKNSLFWAGTSLMSLGQSTRYGDKPLTGMMDNVKIYQTALTDKEIMIEAGIITDSDDEKAVKAEYENLTVVWDGNAFWIDLPEYVGEGVKVSWASSNEDVITSLGRVTFPAEATVVTLTATLTRGEASMTKQIPLTVKASDVGDFSLAFVSLLGDVKFEEGSYYEKLMLANLDCMMELDKERLLANYRKLSGLDTNGAVCYENAGGEGQFESHYMLALAKAAITMPEYTHNGQTLLEQFRYMLTELKKCQDAFALNNPAEAGYVGSIPMDWFYAVEEGRTTDIYGNRVIVPWYIAHKTVQMLLDVYVCLEDVDPEMSALAYEMMLDWCDWATHMTQGRDEATRRKILGVEYGGVSEEFYEIYGITRDPKHIALARFFEEDWVLGDIYNNKDVLLHRHANTWVVKFLACCAAYEATGDEYYKQIAINAYEMIMTRVYAFGGTSCWEHWQYSDILVADMESAETCVTYNMLKYADYLYRWTGDKKYVDYYDRAFTNHILTSMTPESGLKTYLVNSEFGYYKIYLSPENRFECCCSTGQESFAKLSQGIYYTAQDKVIVNMFYPSEINTADGIHLVQSGNFFTDQKTTFTVGSAGQFTISIRIPDYADENTIGIKLNGEAQQIVSENGYINITRDFAEGDTIEYSVPFSFRLEKLPGSERSYALMYGPMVLVADLGDENVNDIQTRHITWGTAYTGPLTDNIVLADALDKCTDVSFDEAGNITVILTTQNQGELTFVPFNQIFHSRYGMYFEYFDTVEEANAQYLVKGDKEQYNFDSEQDIASFAQYASNAGENFTVSDGKLCVSNSGESKLMMGMDVQAPYAVDLSLSAVNDGALNTGVYLYASNAADGVDQIKAYNVQVERASGADIYKISVYKFNSGYLDAVNLGTTDYIKVAYPEDGQIDLRIYAGTEQIAIFAEGSAQPVLVVDVDKSFIGQTQGDVGIRSYYSSATYDNLTVTVDTPEDVPSFLQTFDDTKGMALYSSSEGGFAAQDGKLVPVGDPGEFKAIYFNDGDIIHSVSTQIHPTGADGEIEGGLYVGASNASHGQDAISGLYIGVESNFPHEGEATWQDAPNRVDLVIGSFPAWQEHVRVVSETGLGNNLFADGVKEPLVLRAQLDGNTVTATLSLLSDPSKCITATYTADYDLTLGKVGIRSQHNSAMYDDFTVNAVARVGDQAYASVTEAIANANAQAVVLLTSSDEAITVNEQVTLDLAGYSLSDVTVENGSLQLIDTVSGGTAAVNGSVETLTEHDGKTYLVVGENGVYSAHAYSIAITHISLDPANDALGYKAKVIGDEVVQSQVTGIGFNLWVDGGNVKTYTTTGKQEVTLRLKNILAAGGGEMNINATAFVILGDHTETSTQQTTTMKQTLQAVNQYWTEYTDAQRSAVKALCDKYYDIVRAWGLENILTPEVTAQ